MKTACLFALISLALTVSATAVVQDNPCHNFGQGNGTRSGQVDAGSNNGASNSTSTTSTSSATSTSTATSSALNPNSTANGAGAASGSADPQSSLTLNNLVIATGFMNNGQEVVETGQVPSLTSSNNFINFCLTNPNLPITNGKQIVNGSCNPAPMGMIPSKDNMPSAKFVFPTNGDTSLFENAPFTIQMAIQNIQTGNFVNPNESYLAAPQQLNPDGHIIGHSHVVIEPLSALNQTKLTNPSVFAFFKGMNIAAVNGILSTQVTGGLPAGFYKLSSMNAAANHQPVLVAVAQHGSLDDAVYFTVKSNASLVASASTQSKQGKRSHPRALN